MKIFLLFSKLEGGGTEKQIFYLSNGLNSKGYDVSIGTLYSGGIWWDQLAKVKGIKLFSFKKNPKGNNLMLFYTLIKHLKEEKYDELQSFLHAENIIGILAAKLSGIEKRFSGIRSTSITYSGWQQLFVMIINFLDLLVSGIFARKIIYNSYAGRRYYESLGFPRNKSVVIWNGLEFSFEKRNVDKNSIRENFKISADNLVITAIGNINVKKDYRTLLMAMNELKENNKCRLLIVGSKQDKILFNELLETVKIMGLKEIVTFTGYHQNIYSILSITNIFISSSQEEGLSISIIEAMVMGKNIVATKVGENNLLLKNGRGRIVPPGDYKALSLEIESLLNNKINKINYAAKKFVFNNFKIEKMVSKYEKTWFN